MTDAPPIAELYRGAQASFAELARAMTREEWSRPVPCCPSRTARDVLSHAAGIPDDALNGRLGGVGTDPWTSRQVQRWRVTPVDELLAQWDSQAESFADMLQQLGDVRASVDCHSHEHDVRQAIRRPGNRHSAVVLFAGESLAALDQPRALTVEFEDGRCVRSGGDGTPITLRGMTTYEVFRSRMGRRSVGQVRAYHWSEPPADDLLDAWFNFGPNPSDIDE